MTLCVSPCMYACMKWALYMMLVRVCMCAYVIAYMCPRRQRERGPAYDALCESMYVCMFACIHSAGSVKGVRLGVSVCMCACAIAHMGLRKQRERGPACHFVCMYVCMYVHSHHMYVRINANTYAYTHKINICVHIHVCTYTHTYINTYIHTVDEFVQAAQAEYGRSVLLQFEDFDQYIHACIHTYIHTHTHSGRVCSSCTGRVRSVSSASI